MKAMSPLVAAVASAEALSGGSVTAPTSAVPAASISAAPLLTLETVRHPPRPVPPLAGTYARAMRVAGIAVLAVALTCVGVGAGATAERGPALFSAGTAGVAFGPGAFRLTLPPDA